jgi:hypothetical protein
MEKELIINPIRKKKNLGQSYLGNFNESEFAPIMNGNLQPKSLIPKNNLESPGLHYPTFKSRPNEMNPYPFPGVHNQYSLTPTQHFSSNLLNFESDVRNINLSASHEQAKNTLKNIISQFGVQFYLKVLEEYYNQFGLGGHYFDAHVNAKPNGDLLLGKRQTQGLVDSNFFGNLENSDVNSQNPTFKIQKINFSSTKNESLFSLLNGNLQCPASDHQEKRPEINEKKVTSIDRYEAENKNPKNMLVRLYDIICGKQPKNEWFQNWEPSQVQIFWLLLFKMGTLPEDWQISLQKSTKIPDSIHKLKSVSHKTNMLINRVLIKILNRYYYQARDRNCTESEGVLRKLLSKGKTQLLPKDFKHFGKIVGLKLEESQGPCYIDITKIQNQYLNRKMKEVLCSVLVKQERTLDFYQEVREEVLTNENHFQAYHKNKVFKKLRMAISKIDKFLMEGGRLPVVGGDMDVHQTQVFKKLKIPPPLQNWVDAFLQVDELLSLISPHL